MKRDIVIATCQFPVSGKIEKNLAFILKLMTQANHKGAEIVFVFDAVYSGGTAGAVYRLDAVKESLADDLFQLSTHKMGIVEAVELSRVLNQLPPELILYGIAGQNFGQGQGLSLPCKRSALNVIRRVLVEIGF